MSDITRDIKIYTCISEWIILFVTLKLGTAYVPDRSSIKNVHEKISKSFRPIIRYIYYINFCLM